MITLLLTVALQSAAPAAVVPAPFAPQRCDQAKPLVVLWHKDTDGDARTAVIKALEARCLRVVEEIDGNRRVATDAASLLGHPLIAVKAVPDKAKGALSITVDVIDATQEEELKVLAHASASAPGTRFALAPRLVAKVLDAVTPKL